MAFAFRVGFHADGMRLMRNKMDQLIDEKDTKIKELESRINELTSFRPSSPIERFGFESYVVDSVLESRGTGGATEYRIKWDDGSESWEPARNCDCPDLIRAFKLNKKKLAMRAKRAELASKRSKRSKS